MSAPTPEQIADTWLRVWIKRADRPVLGPAVSSLAYVIRAAVNVERERCAAMCDDFSWSLPLYGEQRLDDLSDDVACAVGKQIADAIRRAP